VVVEVQAARAEDGLPDVVGGDVGRQGGLGLLLG
jgi:hypothetical protein